ncbi:nuclear transport factor 2 family protein [Frankia sp. AgPm24]|uniref:Nuclear transport factor 2 family protein n=1 Tax=Frankia umida TaxID=573489 RepID=A0ABT0JSS1_9ACTN|nr:MULTISPECIES: nuclear transport factor 2 family protein [Frankia]MCK9874618.1 nuclear transport factor 2 family protein [Frankia umida]MCK9922725.1 nuclear transport factor 2 family protein [Frankia sp. AgPm24]
MITESSPGPLRSAPVMVGKSAERQVEEVVAAYVRAADHRDGPAMAALFTEDAVVEIYYTGDGGRTPLGSVRTAARIGQAVAAMMAPHPPRGWSHHTTFNHIVDVDGDTATIDVQFLVHNVVGRAEPEGGWPPGTSGAQGTITPIESGYNRSTLRRVEGRWLIAEHVISHDLPYAFPRD